MIRRRVKPNRDNRMAIIKHQRDQIGWACYQRNLLAGALDEERNRFERERKEYKGIIELFRKLMPTHAEPVFEEATQTYRFDLRNRHGLAVLTYRATVEETSHGIGIRLEQLERQYWQALLEAAEAIM